MSPPASKRLKTNKACFFQNLFHVANRGSPNGVRIVTAKSRSPSSASTVAQP